MVATPRPSPMTPEQEAAWITRKVAQWQRLSAAFAPPEAEPDEDGNAPAPAVDLHVSMVQTRTTFMVYARGDGFSDEFCLGSPAHTVIRDDRAHAVPGHDASDADVEAAIRAWKARRKVTAGGGDRR